MSRHLLVIGAQRCGTTYLAQLLESHPQIAMARPARPEPKVFLDPELSARGRRWYRNTWFSHADGAEILGDKSTSYLEHPAAAARARAMLGDPLVHVQLRDPVRRAISNWAFSRDNGLEQRPLDAALLSCLEGGQTGSSTPPAEPVATPSTSVSPFAYLSRGRYLDYLEPWLAEFDEDLSIGFLEDLVADPTSIATLYRFLGVDAALTPSASGLPVNASAGSVPDLHPELDHRLRNYFADSDAALSALLGRPLPWPTSPATAAAEGRS